MTEPRTLEQLFEQARLIDDPVERELFLKTACGGDSEQEQQLRGLLEYAEHPSILDGTLTEVALANGGLSGDLSSIRVGQWQVLRVLGRGGMGVVYLAEQQEPVYRQAALKMIQLGCQSREAIWRFEQEQQTLSRLDHPNIARLIDASILPTGTSWMVMEYVRGQDLLSFCESNSVPLEQRLRLFLQCCSAIRHAHQCAVIHRDLKPSNILVAGSSVDAVVKVIDFGVAKVMSETQSLAGRLTPSEATRSGTMPGTLKYMSPEQARNGEMPVDTRTDVYSLGAVLYVLLTGYEAHSSRGAVGAVEQLELLQQIINEEPLSMSRRILQEATGAEPARRETATSLARQLRGDLDAIVQKAMAKELHRRYQSVDHLAEDIEKHLNQIPIDARPHSLRYQIGRKLARNKGVCLAALSIFISLVTGLLIAVSQRNRAESSELSLRSRNYSSDLMLASLLLQRGDSTQANAALERQIPADGNTDSRSFDWKLLRTQTVNDVALLHREPDALYFVCPLPETQEIAACGRNGDIVIIDVETGHVRRRIEAGQGEVNGLARSPDGKLLASAGDDGTLAVWDIGTGREVGTRARVHQRQAWQVGWAPDGKALISCGNEKGLQMIAFPEMSSLGMVPTQSDMESLSVSGQGLVAAGGEASTLKVMPLAAIRNGIGSGLELQSGFAPGGRYFNTAAVCFSPDGRFMAVLSQAIRLQIFDVSDTSFREIHRWDVVDRGECVAFSPSGQFLAVGMRNGTVQLFEFRGRQSVLQLSLSQEAAKDGSTQQIVGDFQQLVESSEPPSIDGTYSADVRRIFLHMKTPESATALSDRYRFAYPAGENSADSGAYFLPEDVSVVGKTVTLTLPADVLFAEQNVRGKQIWQAHVGEVTSLCFSNDEQRIYSVGEDGTLCSSRISSLQPLILAGRNVSNVIPMSDHVALTTHGPGTSVPRERYATSLLRSAGDSIRSHDARWPLTGLFARHVHLTRDGRSLILVRQEASQNNSLVQRFDIEGQSLTSLFETPQGEVITNMERETGDRLLVYEVQRESPAASGKVQAELCLHDLPTNRVLNRTVLDPSDLSELLTSPDQKWCVLDGRPELRVYQLPELTGKTLEVPRATRNALVILPDCRTLVVAFADRTLRRYALNTGELLQETPVIGREIEALTISPDSRTLIGCSSDGTLQCWSIQPFLQTMILQLPVNRLRSLQVDRTGDAIWLRDQFDQLFLMDVKLDERFLQPSKDTP